MKEQIKSLWNVNGKPIGWVIGQYVEKNDIKGLAEFFRAHLEDVSEAIEAEYPDSHNNKCINCNKPIGGCQCN